MGDPIIPGQTDSYEQTTGECAPLGGVTIQTRQGVVFVQDAPGISCALATRPDPQWNRVVLLAYDPELQFAPGVGIGMATQLTADEARGVAASLLRLANKLDPKAN
jgi:hypothetical protein